jgi:hypothetical protein
MASKQRIQTLKDVGQLKSFLKTYVQVDPATCQMFWQYRPMEEVAENYVDFLTAVAQTGNLLSHKVLSKALRDMYEGDRSGLHAFATCMVDTLRGCRAKLQMLRGGAKTCPAVLKICEAFPSAGSSSSLEESQSQGLADCEVASSEPESEDVVSVGDEPTEAEAAKAALENAMALFGTGAAPMQRSLAKEDSILSIGSSQPPTPEAAAVEDAQVEIKADHPLLTPGAFMYRVLGSWLGAWPSSRQCRKCMHLLIHIVSIGGIPH